MRYCGRFWLNEAPNPTTYPLPEIKEQRSSKREDCKLDFGRCSMNKEHANKKYDTPDNEYLGDVNNDVSSLYVERIDKNRSYYKCTICGRKLSRKQRLETHLSCVHGKEGYHIRKYKRYINDPSVPVPKSTKLDRSKRSATCSNTAISIPQSVVSTELKAVVTTE
ncbi:hypothetical protein pdam_00009401 [Pocillopora damicornis]|uniref:C2H2-type domain-containing protein n=1 Tax=Pocillopora damicornis TaxID=46731 RepID=A0A3M6TLI3_POCDA|nr:hypothetical protein pdam_00009401 [Pocillopora damicornis]